jgi:hypothetical protein
MLVVVTPARAVHRHVILHRPSALVDNVGAVIVVAPIHYARIHYGRGPRLRAIGWATDPACSSQALRFGAR